MTPELRKIWENKPKRRLLILSHLDERDEADADALEALERSKPRPDGIKFKITMAARKKDEDRWGDLVKANPSYARFALEQWNKKRRRGERSAQLDPIERQRRKFALQDVARIRQFCRATFDRSNGKFVYEIAAERNLVSWSRKIKTEKDREQYDELVAKGVAVIMRIIGKSKNRRPK